MKKRFVVILSLLLALCIGLSSCDLHNNTVPLPGSAHHYVPGPGDLQPTQVKLPVNQIAFPYPYEQKYDNGTEQWGLEMVTQGKTILVGRWTSKYGIDKNIEIASFPVQGIGDYPLIGELTLGGKTYIAVSIHINTMEIPTGSGWIILEKK